MVDVRDFRQARTMQTVRESCVHDLKLYKVVYDHLKSCNVCDPNDVLEILHERARTRSKNRTHQVYVSNKFAKQAIRFLKTFPKTGSTLCGEIISHSGAIDQVGALVEWHHANTLAGIPKEFVVDFFKNNIISKTWRRSGRKYPLGEPSFEDIILRFRDACIGMPVLTKCLYQAVHEMDPEVWNRISCMDVIES